MIIKKRLELLRESMRDHGFTYYLIPTADYHNSEYVSDYFKSREYFSGFTGSNGTLLIGEKSAILWTDGRYFIQAEHELSGSGISLYKMGEKNVPDLFSYLKQTLRNGDVLAADGKVMTTSYCKKMVEICNNLGASFEYRYDLSEEIWKERPALPSGEVFIMEEDYAGMSVQEKTGILLHDMKKSGADRAFFCRLDDIMWIFNIRGCDVAYNPVALSYACISEKEQLLFLQKSVITTELLQYAKEQKFQIMEYETILQYIEEHFTHNEKVLVDEKHLNYSVYQAICENCKTIHAQSPAEIRKAVKNAIEIKNLKEFYLQDSVAVTKFIYYIQKETARREELSLKPLTEWEASVYLFELRRQIPGFIEESFSTISAYRENAAMMHYEPSEEKPVELHREGMLLVDSGGQYEGATTDVTRTFFLGETSHQAKEDFTSVAVGMLRLMNAKFLYGCTGRNLDILAREPLWERNTDYRCGTGHGVGYCLNVHEGPQAIRWKPTDRTTDAVLEAGMLITDEPGVYVEGEYGIRTENVILCVNGEQNEYGQFMHFEPLTYVPIDKAGILPEQMEAKDKYYYNKYHREVYQKISPYLNEEEKVWLAEQTAEI